MMKIIDQFLPAKQYFQQETEKENIVLHQTVSSTAKSALTWWAQTVERVAAAFVVDKDGTIYRCFPEQYWAHHLGLRTRNNTALNKRSIGIEFVNEGFTWPSQSRPGARCWLRPDGPTYKGLLLKTEQPWRGCDQWPAYTPQQVQAGALLVDHLIKKYNIKRTIAPVGIFDIKAPDKYGVYCHHNVRIDKTDLSPVFPWTEFNKMAQIEPISIIL